MQEKLEEKLEPKPALKPCPICGKPASEATLPFCSPRCRDGRFESLAVRIPMSSPKRRDNEEEDAE